MRYYYTDPMAAAWMAKHHFMRIIACESPLYEKDERERDIKSLLYSAADQEIDDGSKYYIHPDSVHILEPQIDDIGMDTEEVIFLCEGITPGWSCLSTDSDGYTIMKTGDIKIIQRNGIAFMYPEKEK
jgi:hypothetical protein